jgi:hypothetical protein
MEPQAAENKMITGSTDLNRPIEFTSKNQLDLRDFLQRQPGNVVRDSAPNIYLDEFLTLQRPAYRPDGRGMESKSWLTLGTENIYKTVHNTEAKTSEQTAENYLDNATRSLKKSLTEAQLKFTTDGAAPKVVEFQNDYKVTAGTNANELAAARLGPNATPEQLEKYAATIVAMNKLDAPDKEIAAGQSLKLPGQTADGGITNWSKGKTYTVWHDGSSTEVAERGQGKATFTERASGCEVTITWNPEDKKGCTISKTYDERRIETDADGVRSEKLPPDWGLKSKVYQDEQDRKVSMEFNPKDNKLLRVSIQDWKTGSVIELEPNDKGLLKGKKTDKSGDVLANMEGRVSDDKVTLYEVRKLKDVLTRTYENGTVEEFKADKLTRRTGKDDWGRQIEEVLKPAGRMPPHQVHVTLNDSEDPAKKTRLTFTRTDFGEYWGESMKDGKVNQRFQLRASGQIMFHKGQKSWSDLKDGTHVERSQVYDSKDPKKVSGYKVSQSKDGATYTVITDRDGNIQSDKYSYGGLEGREIERLRATNGRLFTGMTMTERGGHKTDLTFDVTSGMFTGQRRDATGKAVENVVVVDDKIIYTKPDGNRRIEVFDLKGRDMLGKKPRAGLYDVQQGTESFENDDESLSVKPVANGRTDKVVDDYCMGRTVVGSTIRGERSRITPEFTVVHNPDGSGIRLNNDMTVDRWGEKETDNALKEPLAEAEAGYLKYLKDSGKENEIDLRDFAEIHRQFVTRPDGNAVLGKFYTALKTLDTTKNLTVDELKALRLNIMRDVAHPEEIDQSRSPTCNTEVVRREMVMNCPDEYVMRFHNAMNDSKVPIYTKPVDGAYGSNKEKADAYVYVDPQNLKLADCTGRNIAARIFDNMSIQISAYPDYNWEATEDGLGKFVPKDAENEPREFSGMQMGDIADVLTKLTGVKRGVLQLAAIEDLNTAFEANGKKSMIVAVNASKAPFTWERISWDFDELYTNHVVTLTNIYEEGGSNFVNFMNQWGLESDHSTRESSVPIERFLNNMTGINTSWRGTRPMTPPQVISQGDPSKVYKVEGGKIVEDPKYCIKDGRVQER